MKTTLTVELNHNAEIVKELEKGCTLKSPGGPVIMITPPLNEDYWIARVKVSDNQAVVAFPKFCTLGVGFQKEEADWNTNLPYTCGASEFFRHIKANKGDNTIPNARCIEALELLIAKCYELTGEKVTA